MAHFRAKSIAHANIAIAKYWGKRDAALNLPAVGSVSLTLEALKTETSITLSDEWHQDTFLLNGKPAQPDQQRRLSDFVDLLRRDADPELRISVESENNFPTGAGLASSASGFAALTVALNSALSLDLSDRECSILARRGSGSAARSIFGGIVEMHRGTKDDGIEDFAEQLYGRDYWDLRLLILITSEQVKKIGSTEGMEHTKTTSPYFSAWVDSSERDLRELHAALDTKNFHRFGNIAERSCLKMHGLAMSSDPGVLYWNDATVRLIHKIRSLREDGIPAYFTIDAGPQVKVLCLPENVEELADQFRSFPGVEWIIPTGLGSGARAFEASDE